MDRKPDLAETEGNGHHTRMQGSAVALAAPVASGEFQKFIADIEDLITSMTPLTGEDLARAKAQLSERVVAAKESLLEASDDIAGRARNAARSTNAYVQEHPWQAVGLGAAIGMLIGIAVSRRS